MVKQALLAGASAVMLALAVPTVVLGSHSVPTTIQTLPYSIYNLQRALNDLGYAAGPVDGVVGGRTRSAIRAYQIDSGLPASGVPSLSLFGHLQTSWAEHMGLTPRTPIASVSPQMLAEIQVELRERGYDIPAVTGTLDAATTNAIRAYQGDARVAVTGVASASLLEQLRIGTNTSASRTLTRAEVVRLQEALTERGYAVGPQDGIVGPKVRAAIRTFQADAGLPVTGEASRSLLASLEESEDRDDVADDADADDEDSDTELTKLEAELQRHLYYVGDVDGEIDDQTRIAIRAYQRDAGLPVTGEVSRSLLQHLRTSSVRNRSESTSLLVWEIENELHRLGYAAGSIDGTADDQARLAIKTYQRTVGLPRDGKATFALLRHIETSNQRNNTQTANVLIWEIENELNRRGYKVGPVDGTKDQQTTRAIREYEEDAGLSVTGRADENLLAHLETADPRQISQTEIREIERRLQRRGYAPGAVDGFVDMRTTGAIKAYQADASLRITGRPSFMLLQHLRTSNIVAENYDPPAETVQQLFESLMDTIEENN